MAGCGRGDIRKIIRMLKQEGWKVEVGKHYVCEHPKGGKVIMALTPSDHRALNNIKADIKRIKRRHGETNNDRTDKHTTHRLLKPTEKGR